MYTEGVIFEGLGNEEIELIKESVSRKTGVEVEDITEENIFDYAMNFLKDRALIHQRRKLNRQAEESLKNGFPNLKPKKIEKPQVEEMEEE